MTKWLVMSKNTPQYWSLPSAERIKMAEAAAKTTKTAIESGLIKDVGHKADNSGGYYIMEGTETQVFEWFLQFTPYVAFEATPVISLAQFSEALKKRAAAIGK
jgi:hypothetical protein